VKALLLITLLAASSVKSKPAVKKVTLDVKNADVREVLLSLKEQCGVKNMVIDPDVPSSAATFIFRDVPCDSAFRIVFRTFRLTSQPPVNSVVHVERQR
jgi:hypothetical protein